MKNVDYDRFLKFLKEEKLELITVVVTYEIPKNDEEKNEFSEKILQIIPKIELPKTPALVNTFSWQLDDKVPDIPRTKKFLVYWRENLKIAPMRFIEIYHHGNQVIKETALRHANEFVLN